MALLSDVYTVVNVTILLHVPSSKPHKSAREYCSDLDNTLTGLKQTTNLEAVDQPEPANTVIENTTSISVNEYILQDQQH